MKENPSKLASSQTPVTPVSTTSDPQAAVSTNPHAPTSTPQYSELTAVQKQQAMLQKTAEEIREKSDESAFKPTFRATFEKPDPKQQLKEWEEATQAVISIVNRPGKPENSHYVMTFNGKDVILTSSGSVAKEGISKDEEIFVAKTFVCSIQPIIDGCLTKLQKGNFTNVQLQDFEKIAPSDQQILTFRWDSLDQIRDFLLLFDLSPYDCNILEMNYQKAKKLKLSPIEEMSYGNKILGYILNKVQKEKELGLPPKKVPQVPTGIKKIPEEGSKKGNWKNKK